MSTPAFDRCPCSPELRLRQKPRDLTDQSAFRGWKRGIGQRRATRRKLVRRVSICSMPMLRPRPAKLRMPRASGFLPSSWTYSSSLDPLLLTPHRIRQSTVCMDIEVQCLVAHFEKPCVAIYVESESLRPQQRALCLYGTRPISYGVVRKWTVGQRPTAP